MIVVAAVVGIVVLIAVIGFIATRSSDDDTSTSTSTSSSTNNNSSSNRTSSSSGRPGGGEPGKPATGPTISTNDGSTELTLPAGWDGDTVESGIEGFGQRLFPDDPDAATLLEQRLTVLPRAVVLCGIDVAAVENRSLFTPNVNVLPDATAPTSLSLEEVGKLEAAGLRMFAATIVEEEVVQLDSGDAYRVIYDAGEYSGVAYIVKGSDSVWVLTYSFGSQNDENVDIAQGSANTFQVP